jgi:hypothetical protein
MAKWFDRVASRFKGSGGPAADIRQKLTSYIKPTSYINPQGQDRTIQPFARGPVNGPVVIPRGMFSSDPFASSVPYTDHRGYMQPTWPPMYLETTPPRERRDPPGWDRYYRYRRRRR